MKKIMIMLLCIHATLHTSDKKALEMEHKNPETPLSIVTTVSKKRKKSLNTPKAPQLNSRKSPNIDISPLLLGPSQDKAIEQEIDDINANAKFNLD